MELLDREQRRLRALAAQLQDAGGALAAVTFPVSAPRSLPLRSTPATSSLNAPPRALLPPSTSISSANSSVSSSNSSASSLFSLVSAAAYSAKESAASQRASSWQDALQRLATELLDGEAEGRVERLRRRHESLAAAVRMLEERVRRPADEVTLNERVESQLEREEREWEAQMQVREQKVAELEVELKALRDDERDSEGEEGTATEEEEDEDENNEEISSAEEEEDEVPQQSSKQSRKKAAAKLEARNRELREAVALREEEKRDIEAAIESLRRKRRRRTLQDDGGGGASPKRPRVESARSRELEGELITLRAEKDALQQEIMQAEERSEQLDKHKHELPGLRKEISALKDERDDLQETVETRKQQLERLKEKMKHMVDVQLLTARDTNPPTLREEAVLLHLLYEHAGELGVNELKQQAAAVMLEHGKPPSSAAVIRALYSLVANGVVQIDRSYGNGLVTSLLV